MKKLPLSISASFMILSWYSSLLLPGFHVIRPIEKSAEKFQFKSMASDHKDFEMQHTQLAIPHMAQGRKNVHHLTMDEGKQQK